MFGLAERYNWTPKQVGELTTRQVHVFLDCIKRDNARKVAEQRRMKNKMKRNKKLDSHC